MYVIRIPTLHNVSSARLVTAELPLSFFVFTSSRQNTSLTVLRNNVAKTITIPDGNYSFGSMTSALETALNAAYAPETFTVTIDAATLRCTLASPGATSVAVDTTNIVSPAKTQWGLAYFLGFPKDVVSSDTGDNVQSSGVCCMSPEPSILMDIEELSKVHESGIYASGDTRTFAKIPINADSFDFVYYDKAITYNTISPPLEKLEQLRIKWRFHNGDLVEFNDVEHSFTLEFECTQTR